MPKQTRLDESAEIYQHNEKLNEKDKLRDMSWGERFHYLWEYYRLHAFAAIASIAIVAYIIYSIVTPDIHTRFYAAIINNTINTELLDEYQQDFFEHLGLDPKTEQVMLNYSFYFNSPTDYGMTMRQAFNTYIAAKEIDVIIAPKSEFAGLAYNGFTANLSEQLPTDLYSSLADKFYISRQEEDPDEKVYGIYLTETDLFKNNALNTDPYILGIVVNAENKQNAVEFIRYLFQQYP